MKKFSDVERTRREYHAAPERNSVHRSAAIFPIKDARRYKTNLTFLNHWRIKRGIPEVGARHTLRDEEGHRLGQVFFMLDQSKVYSFDLPEAAEAAGLRDLPLEGTWEVEFFAARNLFIPYPAVVMNTGNGAFHNQVHAYARSLSDSEEDGQVNKVRVREACIDVVVNRGNDTFVELINGPFATKTEVAFTLMDQAGHRIERAEPFVGGPYAKRTYWLSEVFGSEVADTCCNRSLLVGQPRMDMFFSRLLGGHLSLEDGAFSANHSYYDNSQTREYWTIDPSREFHSSKNFPLFDHFDLILRLYPVMSPSCLSFHVILYDEKGRRLEVLRDIAGVDAGSSKIVEFDLGSLGKTRGARSAELCVTPRGGDQVPMRIALQVCYGSGRGLSSSINISLLSPYVFAPSGKTGKSWLEVSGDAEIENRVGFYHTAPLPDEAEHEVRVTLYRAGDEDAREATLHLCGKQAWAQEADALFPGYKEFLGGRNGFLYAESSSQFLRGLTVQTHQLTGHTSGEHSF